MACCYGHNFIVVAVAKPKKKMEKRIVFMKIFFLKHTKLFNLLGIIFLPVYAIFRAVKLIRFVGGKMMSSVFSSL